VTFTRQLDDFERVGVDMRRTLVLLTALALAVFAPAGAVAKKHAKSHGKHGAHKAKVLRAKLTPLQGDVAAYTPLGGKAQMVANKRNAKVSLHVKGLTPGTTYTWAVATGTCASGPVPLAGEWKYKRLKANKSGNGNSKASTKKGKFVFDPTATYSVVVYAPGTTDVLLCGQFKGKTKKAKKQHSKTKGGSHKQKPAKGKGKPTP
jgi:hypothetical protein